MSVSKIVASVHDPARHATHVCARPEFVARRSDARPALLHRQLDAPAGLTSRVHAPGFIHRRDEIAVRALRQRDAADVVLELIIRDVEPLPQGQNLRCIGESRLQDRLKVIVVRVDDAVSRHGHQTLAAFLAATRPRRS